ncbi:CBO0543 family protein [Neobacillus sp. OS1-2]|uniref:CBO0543 family protein n=1 Tax=Neobacillus sp. OS1-2 TaxID=3070680 RepID=UPI0027DFDB8A|nr:CBO0543 family protein [Neobacillus sp. OS1-2]WML39562.1 CBO0543 family protein [Neobacillus sp. OS1-2]
MKTTHPSYDEIRNIEYKLGQMKHEYWIHHDLFSFQWWVLLFVLIFPWIFWLRYVDKKRITEIVLFGSLLMLLVELLDDIGINLHLWSYPYQLFQLIPRLTPIDNGIIIVAHMFVFQFFEKWKSFLIANLVMATIFTFIFEPITVWLNIYKLEHWKYVYSLPIYIIKAGFIKWVVERLINIKNETIRRN